MATYITENENVRTIADDFSGRQLSKEYKCKACGDWIDEDDTVWIPNWEHGEPYHVDCAPEDNGGE